MFLRILCLFCLTLNVCILAESNPQPLRAGRYSRYHHNPNFRITPPKEFDGMKPVKNGLLLTNTADNLTVSIHAFKMKNKDKLSDQELLDRFKLIPFRNNFFKSINDLSERKVVKAKFKNINNKPVFEIILKDPTDQLKPLRSIIFYEFGKEYRITLETENYGKLIEHSHFIEDVFETIGILK